jgi:hypothetical protein
MIPNALQEVTTQAKHKSHNKQIDFGAAKIYLVEPHAQFYVELGTGLASTTNKW